MAISKDKVKEGIKNGVRNIDFDKGFDETTKRLWNGSPAKRRGSIIASAKQNMFEFPVFISNNVPLEYATATTALLDQVYLSYLQMAISVNPVVNEDDAKKGLQFAGFKTDISKYLEYTDMSYAHDACHAVYEEDRCVVEFNMISIEDSDAKIINEYCDHEPLSEFSHYFQEAEKVSKDDYDDDDFKSSDEKDVVDKGSNKTREKEGGEDEEYSPQRTKHTPSKVDKDLIIAQINKYNAEYDKIQKDLDNAKKDGKLKDAQLKKIEAELRDLRTKSADLSGQLVNYSTFMKNCAELERIKLDMEKKMEENSPVNARLDKAVKAAAGRYKAPQLDESAMQRLNTMKPLTSMVTLKSTDDFDREYIIGVKTYSRLIDASILPEVAEYPLKEMNKISRKAKWRAGELKFFKDIVFKIKQKKQTAIDSKDPKRKWYRRLYTLAHSKGDALSAGIFSKRSQNTGVLPNVSIIITKGDVDNVKAQTDIDLLDSKTATNFCNELFLMAFIVIDNDAGSIKILLPDLHNDFEIHSLASVNKQLASLDTAGSKTREVFKMLG